MREITREGRDARANREYRGGLRQRYLRRSRWDGCDDPLEHGRDEIAGKPRRKIAYPLLTWGWHPQTKAPHSANPAPQPPDLREPPRLEVEGPHLLGVRQNKLPSHLLS